MKKNYYLLTVFLFIISNSFSQSGNGHTQTTTLSYTPSGYSTAAKMLQDAGSTALAKSTINNNAATHAFVNFIFDTTGKSVYVVYTTDGSTPNKSNGSQVTASFSNYSDPNRTFTTTIPSQSAGTTVKYLFYISDGAIGSSWGIVDANGYATSWGEGSVSAFSYVVKTANTQTGTWATSSTWAASAVPTSSSDVEIIASTTVTVSSTSATSNDLTTVSSGAVTIAKNGAVTVTGDFTNSSGNVNLNSDSNEFASLIVQGSSSGDIIYKRWVADEDTSGGTGWDLIGSPVAGQGISAFVSANSNIADNSGEYAIGVFSNNGSTDTAAAMYTNYTTGNVGGAGNFTAGQGYAMATDDTAADGSAMDFTGTIRTTDLTDFAIDDNSSGATNFGKFNLVANPFPSFLNANDDADGSNNFLTVNITADNLHDTYASVYGYDGDGTFTAYNHSSPGSAVYIAPGQGFFVASDDSGGNTISFTEAMQTVSGGDDFNSQNDVLDDVFQVSLRLYHGEEEIEETHLYFENGLSLGLDPGYDAGAFDQNSALMTRLVEEDEGHGLEINTMSTEDMDDVVIPLEINQTAGQEFRINLHTSTIGEVNIYLEDTELQTLTLLNDEDFVMTPTSDLSDAGRFYVHLTANTLSNEEVNTSLLNAYKEVNANYITIEGLATQATSTKVSLYNILGTKVMDTTLDNTTNTQTISTNGFATGIYIIKLESGKNQLTKKLIIK